MDTVRSYDTLTGCRARRQRWHASGELWEHYLQIGGSFDAEADTEGLFCDGRPPEVARASSP